MSYPHFNNYARFLLDNHLEELVAYNVKRMTEEDLPFLKLFKGYSKEEFFAYLKNRLSDLLAAIAEDRAIENIREINTKWKAGNFPAVPATEIVITDIVLVHSLRKESFIRWIRKYTNDIDVYEQLVLEIETFYAEVFEQTFTTFIEIQQDILLKEKELTETVLDASFNSVVAIEAVRNSEGSIVDFKYVLLNEVAEKMLNRDKDFILNNTLLQIFPSVEKEGILDLYKSAVETGEGFSFEFYYPYEGFNHWLRQSAKKWKDGLVITTIDITPLKESQQELENANTQLRKSEEKLKELNHQLEEKIRARTNELLEINKNLELTQERFILLSKATNDPIWDWDLVNNSLWWSQGFYEVFGYDQEEEKAIDNDQWLSRIHPEDRERVIAGVKDVINKGKKNWKDTYRFRHKDGTYQVVYDRGFTVRSEKGEVVRIVGSMLNMNDRKIVEEKLKTITDTLHQNENQLKVITNSLPAFISYVDNELTYRYANDYYSRLSGFNDAVAGKRVVEVLGHEWFEHAKAYIERALNGEQVSFNNKFELKDGSIMEVDTKYVPDIDSQGNVAGFVVLGIDLTERLQFERMLEKQNKELVKINWDLDNFIYTASHDLRAPVSNIEGLINTLEDSLQEERSDDNIIQPVLNMMHKSVDKFKGTIQDLTEISKVQRRIGDEKESINLPHLLQDVLFSIRDIIQSSGAVIREEFNGAENIKFSRKNLKSIFYNLISNAIKYRKQNMPPEIHISSKYIDNQIELTVTDNGMGIARDQQEKIFSMFKRFHTHVEGTGVGLYIVKRIVDNAGGRILVKSEEGKGASFKILLPLN